MSPDCYSPLALLIYFADASRLPLGCEAVLASLQDMPTGVSIEEYFKAFSLTFLLEAPFYLAAIRNRKFLLALLLCNLATHPAVYFLIPALVAKAGGEYASSLAIAEVFAPLLEAVLLAKVWKVPAGQATAFAVSANLFSWWLGIYLAV